MRAPSRPAASGVGKDLAEAPLAAPIEKPHVLGHRQRLRERLLTAGPAALADYELLEMLLFAALPRGDTKPLAKSLIAGFGSFAGVLNADPAKLALVAGMGEAAVASLVAVREAGFRMLRAEFRERPILGSWEKVVDYCSAALAHSTIEEFHLLFLDRKNALLADERQQTGTVDHTPVYPREVVKRALELDASAIIMVHNHPSGDPTPSKADIETTREVAKAAALLGVALHDHIIIGKGRHTSLKGLGLF
jgi:DNA repair protein RadC